MTLNSQYLYQAMRDWDRRKHYLLQTRQPLCKTERMTGYAIHSATHESFTLGELG
jgi:hypothetical protein